MSQSAIARELHHSDAAVSRQIGILASDGLVNAKPDEQNRRAVIVELTGEGKKLLDELETTIAHFLMDTLSEVPSEELQQLIVSNTRLQTVMTAKLRKEPRA